MPVAQAPSVQRLAGCCLQQPDPVAPALRARSASSARLPRSGERRGSQAMARRAGGKRLSCSSRRLRDSRLSSTPASVTLGAGGVARLLVVQFQAHQQGALLALCNARRRTLATPRGRVLHADARHQRFAQLGVTRQAQVQGQALAALAPAPQAQPGQQHAGQQAIPALRRAASWPRPGAPRRGPAGCRHWRGSWPRRARQSPAAKAARPAPG